MNDVLEPSEFGGCLFPGECCMPGLHFPSECHSAEYYAAEAQAETANASNHGLEARATFKRGHLTTEERIAHLERINRLLLETLLLSGAVDQSRRDEINALLDKLPPAVE